MSQKSKKTDGMQYLKNNESKLSKSLQIEETVAEDLIEIPVIPASAAKEGTKQVKGPTGRMCLVPDIEVFFNTVVTSAHSIQMGALISKELSTTQVVVAAGPAASVKVGDWVEINVDSFPKSRKPGKHDVGTVETIHPPLYKIKNTEYLMMSMNNLYFKINK